MTEQKEQSIGEAIMAQPYWYHRIELPGGNVTPGWAPIDPDKYAIPEDLTGKRVLDIGAWDGYWTWEALKRGASEVVAIDDFSDCLGLPDFPGRTGWTTFDICCEAFGFTSSAKLLEYGKRPQDAGAIPGWENKAGQMVRRHKMSIYDVEELGRFDIIFCFGVLYHLKHPYRALEILSSVCDGEIYIESAVLDEYSPYRGAVGRGYNNSDVVMEFYPGGEYGNNPANWWTPTMQCLGTMLASVGFENINGWPLTDKPKDVPQCRGFLYASKTGAPNEKAAELASAHTATKAAALKVMAVMSIPRLGFMDNSFCILEGLVPLKIPVLKVQGAFWGQCLERGIMQQIDQGAEAVLTVDYDTMFTLEDAATLVSLMQKHPEADAIVPLQCGRSGMKALLTMKTKSGQVREIMDRTEFSGDLTQIATGHFGLTLLRTSSLLKLPHPWFIAEPAPDGRWGPGRVDDDIYFWKKMEAAGMKVFSANRVALGHLELVVTWPTQDLVAWYQPTSDFRDNGKPEHCWR